MKSKKIISLLFPSIIIMFVITSNIYVFIETPLVFSNGCTQKECEGIEFIIENLPENASIFTDLRLSAILGAMTNFLILPAPGSQGSSFKEINTTYNAFYSNDSFKAYYCIKILFEQYYGIAEFYIFFSKRFVSEGITTMDFTFGPIPIESYNMYLNSTYFEILFQNEECFIAKANIVNGEQ